MTVVVHYILKNIMHDSSPVKCKILQCYIAFSLSEAIFLFPPWLALCMLQYLPSLYTLLPLLVFFKTYCINDSIQGNSETDNKIFVLPSKVGINTGIKVNPNITY